MTTIDDPVRGVARLLAAVPERADQPGAVATLAPTLDRLLNVAETGLARMFRNGTHEFAFTRRGRRTPNGMWQTRLDGSSVRYGAIAALGMQHLPEGRQRVVFGETVDEFCTRLAAGIGSYRDLGEVALVAWLAAERRHPVASEAFEVLARRVGAAASAPIVETAWALTAAVAFAAIGDVQALDDRLVERLLSSRGGDGVLFPHNTRPAEQPWFRARVGCFADQVYPVQALARYHRHASSGEALAAADACARRICDLQGGAGQWWWHYDWKRGDVIEGYPVYSVHQHAMAPMALFDLAECGGANLAAHAISSVNWLIDTPETSQQLICDDLGVIWRKVARREPRPKLVRALRAAARPAGVDGALRVLDRIAPPGPIDHECRPYELGWLLYAWLHRTTESTGPSATGDAA